MSGSGSSSHWLRLPRRSSSSGTSPAASIRSRPRSRSGFDLSDYRHLLSLLLSTIPADSKKWRLLTQAWWDKLDDDQRKQVTAWAEHVRAYSHDEVHIEPEVPLYLVNARNYAPTSNARRTADKLVAAMVSINNKSQAKHDAYYTAAHSLGVRPHGRREIGHRMAQIYGTTKREWEAGRSW